MVDMKRISSRNTWPYLILGVIQSLLLLFTFYKYNNKKQLIVLVLSCVGFACIFEFVNLNYLRAYQYKPRFLKNPYLDNIFGAILSQVIYIPFTAVFLSAFQAGWKLKFFFTAYFAFIELTFIYMKVYQHNWWKLIYTVILIPTFFKLSDVWLFFLKRKNVVVRLLSLFCMSTATTVNILFGLTASSKIRFKPGKTFTWHNHFKIEPLYALTISFVSTLFIKLFKERTASVSSFLALKAVDYVMNQLHVIQTIQNKWLHNFYHLFIIVMTRYYYRLIYK
ncbi:hypothetical protein SAMN05421676_10836 [Salinibacillus kushneri]|uniref:Uncharacterized protein n=1 Tax=Salinibacillus kushneri TaxID=237682 RepID=A0A1I0H3W6_9BACI|nr:hypothetical protein [Salinibacillus kushneri]SET78261.1 hypothetical protein SAMN05421676_10836 [Salinibacillus kushneri]